MVVANGCCDATVERAGSFAGRFAERGWSLRTTAIAEASKPAALNRGDELATTGIRIYLDADVVLSPNALSAVVTLLQPSTGAEFASPALLVARSGNRFTRNYARIWASLPYVSGDVIGLGFYAVSARGRKRWDVFPQIVADDKFARLHFSECERRIASDASFTVFMPEGLRELIRVRSRWIRANAELARGFPTSRGSTVAASVG